MGSPFAGAGFGRADASMVRPSNMFYPGMAAEIGLIGAAGVFGAMLYPMVAEFGAPSENRCTFRPTTHSADGFAVLVGVFIWLFFEFDVVRVSATNGTVHVFRQ